MGRALCSIGPGQSRIGTISELASKTDDIRGRLDAVTRASPSTALKAECEALRDFCVALSRSAATFERTLAEYEPTHPLGDKASCCYFLLLENELKRSWMRSSVSSNPSFHINTRSRRSSGSSKSPQVICTKLNGLTEASNAGVQRDLCSRTLDLTVRYLPLLGFILRSTNSRNPFEIYGRY